jgi:hypothetical protein
VNNLINARMNKRRQMRWSPHGAHWVLQVRAAVLDGRFGTTWRQAGSTPRLTRSPMGQTGIHRFVSVLLPERKL